MVLSISAMGWSMNGVDPYPNSRASLIADIHTDLNTKKTLEVATGYLEHLIVKITGWNGTDIYAVGPVFSFYEFSSIDHILHGFI